MTSHDPSGGRGLSDAELLSRWLDEADDDAGAASMTVFMRYRELVRSELERLGGLSSLDAVQRVATVFHRAQDARPDLAGLTLHDRLVAVAREVAGPQLNEPRHEQ